MIQYVQEIIVPYVEKVREDIGDNKRALVIIDNFKGQVTDEVNSLLDVNDIDVCLLPPNYTDWLQPMDISVNKLAKAFLKWKFELWYSEQVAAQLESHDVDELESLEIQPINTSLSTMKQVGAKWLVEMSKYICENPQFIVNGFIEAGIASAIDEQLSWASCH